jgi:hypothetical protein
MAVMHNALWRPIAIVTSLMSISLMSISLMFGQVSKQDKAPQFEDYPAAATFHGTPAAPILTTPGQRLFRTMIRTAAQKGPNFAGHYAIAEWGCGTACVSMAVIDVQSGKVDEGPFGMLPKAHVYFGSGEDPKVGMFYRPDSSLLVVRGCPNEKSCGMYYYLWTGSGFKLLRRTPIKPLFGADQE